MISAVYDLGVIIYNRNTIAFILTIYNNIYT
ncbi:hypothetical protein SAMN05216331_13539 [Porphyromonadaceae bacterium KH3R12]|nr:hypothetical protein SAMN05216331_13539 [Porphyromonadaceae bacterium KH3R12]